MADGQIDAQSVEKAIAEFKDPESGQSILAEAQVRDIQVRDIPVPGGEVSPGSDMSGTEISLSLALTTWTAPIRDETRNRLDHFLRERFPTLTATDIQLETHPRPAEPVGDIGLKAKSVIPVGSGKGGVGKSTIAASIAFGLQRSGAQVGLLDADVYGPSIPHMLGASQRPQIINEKIEPIRVNGMPVMSMGFLIPPNEAVVWRGPMLHGAISQFLKDTDWGELDYLIIDMPPGTGDVALTLSQLIPLAGAVVVCTPQDIALLDAVKAITMFGKVSIPILGMVENMSGFVCPDCDKRYDIFGNGGARRRAEELGVPFLGDVPITMRYRELGDAGQVPRCFDESNIAAPLEQICKNLVAHLAESASNRPTSSPLPTLD